jgi:hypothetical protein
LLKGLFAAAGAAGQAGSDNRKSMILRKIHLLLGLDPEPDREMLAAL